MLEKFSVPLISDYRALIIMQLLPKRAIATKNKSSPPAAALYDIVYDIRRHSLHFAIVVLFDFTIMIFMRLVISVALHYHYYSDADDVAVYSTSSYRARKTRPP